MKILAVDDIEANRYLLRKLLEGYGYAVDTARNGIEALEKVRGSLPDMIITDVLMPEMDGFQLCRTLKGDETLKSIPVLFYSATYTDKESRELARNIGAADYIVKPIEPDEFIKIIEEAFKKREQDELKPAEEILEAPEYMRLYTERLVRKLEEKMLDLGRSEATYRSVVESVDDLVCLIDRENRFLACNTKSLERFGWTSEDVVGRKVSDITSDPADAQLTLQMAREVFRTGKPASCERELDFKGQRRYYSSKMAPVFDANGHVAAAACVGRDITERKRAEMALQESEERFRAIFEAAQDAIFIKDCNLKYMLVNPAMERLFDLPASKIIGRTDDDLFDEKTAPHIREMDFRVLEGEIVEEEHAKEINGIPFIFHVIKVPLRDESGEIVGLCGIARDVTEHKAAEELTRVQRDLAIALCEKLKLNETLSLCVEAAINVSGMDCGGGYLIDENLGSADLAFHKGLSPEFVEKVSHYDAGSDNARLMRKGQPVYTRHRELGTPLDEERRGEDLRAIAVIPVLYEGKVIACLNISSHTLDMVPVRARDSLETIAAQIGSVIARVKAEAALRSERDYSAKVVAGVPAIICGIAADGTTTFMNPACKQITGYSAGELVGRNWWQVLYPGDEYRQVEELFREFERGDVYDYEMRLTGKGGEKHVILWSSLNRYDETGSIVEIIGFGNDITGRKQAEEYQSLVSQVLGLLNQSGKKIDVIRDILLVIKKSTGVEAVGIRLKEGEDFPYYETNGFPGDFVEAERYLCAIDQAGELIRDSEGNPCLECMCGNVICGRTDPKFPFFTRGGSFYTNSTTDLLLSTTEEDRQARTRDRCHGEGYESVALIPLCAGGKIIGLLQLNDSRRGIFTSEMVAFLEEIGDSIGIAVDHKNVEQELARHREHLEELVNEKTSQLEEKTMELERANIRLQELDRLKSLFIASMSHELRTPLNSIIGFTGLMLQGLSGEMSDEADEELGIVYNSAKQLLSLINDVIDISRIEADQLETYFEEVNLDQVLRDAVIAVARDAEKKSLEIKTDFPENLSIITDKKRLLQCVLNLLNNAVKFTEEGVIELTAVKEANILKISVRDTGIGIKEEGIQKLFTPFTRLDSPLKERTLGTGLGLYLTKKIMMDVFNGDIMVESRHGMGSTFTLIIPVPHGVVAQ